MLRRNTLWILPLLLLAVCLPAWAESPAAEEKAPAGDEPQAAQPAASKFLRLTRGDDERLVSLDTSIVRYVPSGDENAGLVVDLIGAVHVGEKPYYEQLNKEFESYDAMLYELVAPSNQNTPAKGAKGSGLLAALQTGLTDLLGLEHQLWHVDYTKENFVHADMSPEELVASFQKSMDEHNETLMSMILKVRAQAAAQEDASGPSGFMMLYAMISKNRTSILKRMMAQQFENLEESMALFNGPGGETLIEARNKVALRVLDDQIKAGKKRIAIFYGAAHMPDMEQRLIKDFGLEPREPRWLVAWNLKNAVKPAAITPIDEAKPAEPAPVEAPAP